MLDDALVELERAEELIRELSTEVARALRDETISDRIPLLADEAVRLLHRSLDAAATAVAGVHARFPICSGEAAFSAATRPWRLSAGQLEALRALQPYASRENAWLERLAELGRCPIRVRAKELRNAPRVTVRQEGGGQVTYNAGVRFGPGVRLCGVEIDPETQLPVPTPGITVVVERWGSVVLVDGGEDVVSFLDGAARRIRSLVGSLV